MKRYRRFIRTDPPALTAATNARVEALVPKETVHALMGEGYARVSPYLYEELKAKCFRPDDSPALAFAALWDCINGKTYPWSSNPWVWVISFKALPAGGAA